MLEAITWNTYFSTLAIGLAAYYLIIIGLYYKQEFRNLISGKFKLVNQIRQQEKGRHLRRTDENSTDHFEELEATVAELNGILGKAGQNRTSKDILLSQLLRTLSNHTGLREPAYRVAVINFILENASKYCRIVFSESELEEAWSAQSP
ncbi:hypothetical protein LV84_03671 [Algoriphagus ratkowskyi]|uniref:Uncharacterized protein n=1 Tax=Algoriphagus ratkowskyi TaxID=57028 RepID=A0A2W7QTE6_9BACT|nr:hypothetical protein [Algoriphagus ratkowskyi]PZX51514.1 hypothetical protein LV84_03671 [Algoriphagus ratkowskyi]TXD78797.1 hypothetical protein ESW18_04550 [Algoriphagus ratkowskyi]